MRYLLTCTFLLFATSATFGDIIIDNFSTALPVNPKSGLTEVFTGIYGTSPNLQNQLTDTVTQTGLSTSSVIGGQRRASISVPSSYIGNNDLNITGTGTMFFDTSAGTPKVTALVEYGFAQQLNANLSGLSAFRFNVPFSDVLPNGLNGVDITISLTSGVGGTFASKSITQALPTTGNGTVFDFYLSNFSGINLADVDSISFQFVSTGTAGSPDVGFQSISAVSAIPEPSTWLLGSVGLLGCCLWRKRKNVKG
jgi:hypothetical protein